jgi:hypothetical protein
MPERAKVTSLEAIEAFRARLIVYRDKAGRVLDEVGEDVIRTRIWLQTDRVTFWEGQIRRRQKDLEMRQQELFSAQISGMRDASFVQQQAVQRARRAIQEAEGKLRVVKQWNRQYDQRVEPVAKQVEKLRHNLVHDLGQAIAFLGEVTKTLADYAEMSPSLSAPKPPPEATGPSSAPDPTRSQP